MLISFVILHYQTYKDTEECIESILSLYNNYDIRIIVVDNNSPNHSGELLKTKYSLNNKIEFIFSNQNLGFAKGNNLGFQHAKELKSDFIIMANNDTIFIDPNFINTIQRLYQEEKFGVLGPDIISTYDGIHQNPSKGFSITKKNIYKKLYKLRFGKLLCYLGMDNFIKRFLNQRDDINRKNDYKYSITINSHMDKVLHGSCYIFSLDYQKKFNGLYPKTFMYYEENFLAYLCTINDLKQLYSNELTIEHKGKSATNTEYGISKSKRMFYYKQSIISIKEFLKLYNEERI